MSTFMATSSFIGKIRKDRSVDLISCFFDGYLEHTGQVLYKYYSDSERIDSLLSLGNIICLYPKLHSDSGQSHSFHHPQVGVTIAYARDCGVQIGQQFHYQNLQDFLVNFNHSWCEWVYLYDELDGQWYYGYDNVYREDDLLLLAKEFSE